LRLEARERETRPAKTAIRETLVWASESPAATVHRQGETVAAGDSDTEALNEREDD
jgi:hypothetical protein